MSRLVAVAIATITAFFCALEYVLRKTVRRLREDFQWLITEADERPEFPAEIVDKIFVTSFDSELGWCRRPNSHGTEVVRSIGETQRSGKVTHYNVDARGSRSCPGYEERAVKVATYGDSFTFGRQVNDDQTWQHRLSELTDSLVLNFGVGNYGFDQGLLRFIKEHPKNPAPVTIMGVVPETIVRIHSSWKHYSEYGNIFGFKPRFELRDGCLKYIENPIKSRQHLHAFETHLQHFRRTDYWYKNKFLKDILRPPYSYHLLRSWNRNGPLISELARGDRNAAWARVLTRNFELCRNLYLDPDAESLFLAEIAYFVQESYRLETQPVLVIFPYLSDVEFCSENGCYYGDFLSKATDLITVIDPLPWLLDGRPEVHSLYSSDFYGGHLTPRGNREMGRLIFEELLRRKMF